MATGQPAAGLVVELASVRACLASVKAADDAEMTRLWDLVVEGEQQLAQLRHRQKCLVDALESGLAAAAAGASSERSQEGSQAPALAALQAAAALLGSLSSAVDTMGLPADTAKRIREVQQRLESAIQQPAPPQAQPTQPAQPASAMHAFQAARAATATAAAAAAAAAAGASSCHALQPAGLSVARPIPAAAQPQDPQAAAAGAHAPAAGALAAGAGEGAPAGPPPAAGAPATGAEEGITFKLFKISSKEPVTRVKRKTAQLSAQAAAARAAAGAQPAAAEAAGTAAAAAAAAGRAVPPAAAAAAAASATLPQPQQHSLVHSGATGACFAWWNSGACVAGPSCPFHASHRCGLCSGHGHHHSRCPQAPPVPQSAAATSAGGMPLHPLLPVSSQQARAMHPIPPPMPPPGAPGSAAAMQLPALAAGRHGMVGQAGPQYGSWGGVEAQEGRGVAAAAAAAAAERARHAYWEATGDELLTSDQLPARKRPRGTPTRQGHPTERLVAASERWQLAGEQAHRPRIQYSAARLMEIGLDPVCSLAPRGTVWPLLARDWPEAFDMAKWPYVWDQIRAAMSPGGDLAVTGQGGGQGAAG